MSTYRIKSGIHAIGGVLKIAGDKVELDDKTFAASADLRRHFELLPTAERAASEKPAGDKTLVLSEKAAAKLAKAAEKEAAKAAKAAAKEEAAAGAPTEPAT